jgi:hypothetical protein
METPDLGPPGSCRVVALRYAVAIPRLNDSVLTWSWQEFAGKETALDGDGRSFGELNALRMVAQCPTAKQCFVTGVSE